MQSQAYPIDINYKLPRSIMIKLGKEVKTKLIWADQTFGQRLKRLINLKTPLSLDHKFTNRIKNYPENRFKWPLKTNSAKQCSMYQLKRWCQVKTKNNKVPQKRRNAFFRSRNIGAMSKIPWNTIKKKRSQVNINNFVPHFKTRCVSS